MYKRLLIARGLMIMASLGLFLFLLGRLGVATIVPDDVLGEPQRLGPDIVVSSGTAAGITYRLITYLTEDGAQCVNLDITSPFPSDGGGCGFKVPNEDPLGINVDGFRPGGTGSGATFVYGPVSVAASTVRINFSDGTSQTTAVIPGPPGALSGYFLAVRANGMFTVGSVDALTAAGTTLATENMNSD